MNVGTVLVRWYQGVKWVGEGGREVFLKNTGIESEAMAEELGRAVRDVENASVTVEAYEGEAWTPAQMPGPWRIGDRMGGQPITGYTVTMGPEASAVVVPQLVDPDVVRAEALDRRLTRLAAGGASQWSNPAGGERRSGAATETFAPEFTYSGPLTRLVYSPLYRVPRVWRFTWLDVAVRVPSDTGTLRVVVDRLDPDGDGQVNLATAYIGPGERRAIDAVALNVPAGYSLIAGITNVGGAPYREDLTVTLRGVMA